MVFRGRTVIAFVLLAMFAGCIVTLTVIDSFRPSVSGKTPAADSSSSDADSHNVRSASSGAEPPDRLTDKEILKLNKAMQLITHKFVNDIDHQTIVDGAINGMIAALDDPFSDYMNADEAKHYAESVDSVFTGIGAEVTMQDGKVTVISAIKDSPAEKAGIRSKDVILSVNGDKLDGISLNEAVMKIRGPKGTQAKLEIMRPNQSEPIELIVVRNEINLDTIKAEMLEEQIGKIEIRQFSLRTKQRFYEELDALEAKGMKALIIDVRNNPGGYLTDVLEIIEPLIPKGKTMIQFEDRGGKTTKTVSKGPGKAYPIAVLINGGSASASEILAAALHDSAGSKLLGEKSYGKGTVQNQFTQELGDGSNVKLTIAKWLTPNGVWVHRNGIEPDISVPEPEYLKATPLPRDRTLKSDMTGDEVRNLQLILQGLELDPGRVDGYFGEQTAEAIRAFQQREKLPATGEVDASTADRLESLLIAKIQDPKNDLQLNAAVQYLEQAVK